ncbi:hypothetical protein ACIBF1_35310 [Spirillospora sp. NPDC050679]
MQQSALVFMRGDQIYVVGQSRTTDGYWTDSEPYLALPANVSPTELGAAVQQTLRASQVGVAPPANSTEKAVRSPLLRMARVRTWSTFARQATMVGLVSDGETTTVVRYHRVRGGFAPLPSRLPSQVEARDADSLGDKLLSALHRDLALAA